MITRQLGPDGPVIPALGVGAMSFAPFYGAVGEAEAHAVLDAALEAGVVHIDTSNVYGMGQSERFIGSWLAQRGGGAPVFIATKAGISRDAEGKRVHDNTPEHLEAELDKSLGRLGVERVDLFYVHRRDPRLEIEEVTESLVALMKKGKIASFGYSEIAPTSLYRAAAVHPVAAVQSEYSLQTRQPELGLVQACAALGTALVAFSPVGRGLLTDVPPTPARVAEAPFLRENPRFTEDNLARNVAASAPLRTLAAEAGLPTAALAVGWVLARGEVVHAIPGTRHARHFAELVAGAAQPLPEDLLAEIDRVMPPGWCHGARYSASQSIGPEVYG